MRLTLLLYLISTGPLILAQDRHQDLTKAIGAAKSWEEKAALYDSLIARSYAVGLDAYMSTLGHVIEKGRGAGKHDFAAEYSLELAHAYYDNNLSLDTAIQLLKEALMWVDPGVSTAKRADILESIGVGLSHSDLPDSALHYFLLSAAEFERLGDSTQSNFGKTYLHAAGIAMDLGKFVEASKLLDKSRLIFEFQKDSVFILYTLNDAANLYSMNGFLKKASELRELIIRIANPVTHGNLILVTTLMNWSNEARKLGNDSLELELLRKSVTLVDSASNQSLQYHFVALSKLVDAYSRRGMFEQALYYFDQMESLKPGFDEVTWLHEFYRRAKVDALYSQKKYDAAVLLANEIKADAKNQKKFETVMDMDRVLQRIHYARQDYKSAYSHFVSYSTIKDSLSSIEKANALIYLETQYEDERKKRVIADQENRIQLLATTNQFQARLVWAISLGLVLLFGLFYLYRSRRYVLQSKKMQEHYSQQLISAHEDERKRISRDLHDSVGQSLMLIKNRIVLDQDESTVTMVSQALEEVRTISTALHPVLLEKLGLTASIEKLIRDVDKNADIFFTEEIESIDGIFSKEHELHVFRVVQEALNNMIKHAQTPSALIRITNAPGKVTLRIQDYGVGFDVTEQTGATKSLGMKTLKERTQILGGKLVIDSVKSKGTTLFLEIPKKVKWQQPLGGDKSVR